MSKSKNASQASPSAPDQAYTFCGEGLGLPGLPRTLTRPEAAALGVLDLLEAAITAGVYQPAEE